MAFLHLVHNIFECPSQEDPYPYQDLPGDFSKHVRSALFAPCLIGRNPMTAWEARIVEAERVRTWSQRCAATFPPETPTAQYAACTLEELGLQTRLRPMVIRGAGSERPWDAEATEWLRAAPEPHMRWRSGVSFRPPPPSCATHGQYTPGHGYTFVGARRSSCPVTLPPRGRGHPANGGTFQKRGSRVR